MCKKKIIRQMNAVNKKDTTAKVAKWLKVIESKKKIFELEDEIDKITKEEKSKKRKKDN